MQLTQIALWQGWLRTGCRLGWTRVSRRGLRARTMRPRAPQTPRRVIVLRAYMGVRVSRALTPRQIGTICLIGIISTGSYTYNVIFALLPLLRTRPRNSIAKGSLASLDEINNKCKYGAGHIKNYVNFEDIK
ncbi:hypothetical protein PUN28_002661 [Cardiocondyla obscurior]|uniref:Uncharacterized protein n=1 Tax=Cardiocondyla obscurior TaxID=286306 RepID=A0AAW2GVB7_9HYME